MGTRTVTATLVGISAYSQSKAHDTPFLEKESHEDHDIRTWREKAHYDPKTREVFMPPMGMKMAIAEAAKRLSIKIPGKRSATYTKNFMSGVIAPEPIRLGVTVDDLQSEAVFCNADGIRGSGKRVMRRFPIVPAGWKATATLMIIDDEIPQDVFLRCWMEAGNLIGVGRFRPEKGGYLGRFEVKNVKWSGVSKPALLEAAE